MADNDHDPLVEALLGADPADDNVVAFAPPGGIRPKPVDIDAQEYGVPGNLPVGAWSSFTGADEIANQSTLSIDQLVEMRKKDGQARALLRLFTLPIRRAAADAKWIAPPEGGGDKETEFANNMWTLPPYMGGMTQPWSRVIRQICLAFLEGYSVFEEVRYVPDDGPLKGLIVLKKLAHRDARTVKFRVDERGGFNGVRQVATIGGKVVDVRLPRDKVFYYAANEEENPFYGVSMFEAAYFHHDIKKKLYYISHLAAQFAAVPARVGKLPERGQVSDTKLAQFKKAIEQMAFNTAMTVPQGFDVLLHNMNSGFDFLRLIDHHNNQMSKSVLAKFLDDENRQVIIENSRGDASADLFLMSVEGIIGEVEEAITHYVMPKYIDWNFGTKKYPVLKFGALNDAHRDVIKELFNTIATAQMTQWTPEFIRELEKKLTDRLGLDVDYDEVEKREEEEQAKLEEQQRREAELMEQQFQGVGGGGSSGSEGSGF